MDTVETPCAGARPRAIFAHGGLRAPAVREHVCDDGAHVARHVLPGDTTFVRGTRPVQRIE